MPTWPDGLPPFEDLKSLFAGFVGILGAGYMAWLGATRGKPTSAAAMEAVKAATCGAPALTADISAIKKTLADTQEQNRILQRDHSQIMKDLDAVRDAVNRIEARQLSR